jgi:hypothetical protein
VQKWAKERAAAGQEAHEEEAHEAAE